MENASVVLGTAPTFDPQAYEQKQAEKRKRRRILCLQCSSETEDVYHCLKQATEWVSEKKTDPANLEDQQ